MVRYVPLCKITHPCAVAFFAKSGEPFAMRCREHVRNDDARQNMDSWPSVRRFSEVHETIEQPLATNVLVLCLHVPATITAEVAAGFHLQRAEPSALKVGHNDINIGNTGRCKRGDVAPAQHF